MTHTSHANNDRHPKALATTSSNKKPSLSGDFVNAIMFAVTGDKRYLRSNGVKKPYGRLEDHGLYCSVCQRNRWCKVS